MVDRENLKQLSTWAGFVGIMSIIFGAISALFGLFAFVVGAIPGIITIILGVKLRNAKKYADELLAGDYQAGPMNLMFMNLNRYFQIQGILTIIYLAFILICLLAWAFTGLSLLAL